MHTMYTIMLTVQKIKIFYLCISFHICYIDVVEDFNPSSATATFTSGLTPSSQCININIIPDGDFEGDHNFAVSIMSTSPAGLANTGTPVTVTIQDDDSKCLKASYDAY